MHREDLVNLNVRQSLLHTRGPRKLDLVDDGRIAQTEVDALIAGGVIADGGGCLVILAAMRSRNLHLGSQAIGIVAGADELQNDPVIMVWRAVHPPLWGPFQFSNHTLYAPIVFQTPERCTAIGRSNAETCACCCTHVFKYHLAAIMEDTVRQRKGPVFYLH